MHAQFFVIPEVFQELSYMCSHFVFMFSFQSTVTNLLSIIGDNYLQSGENCKDRSWAVISYRVTGMEEHQDDLVSCSQT